MFLSVKLILPFRYLGTKINDSKINDQIGDFFNCTDIFRTSYLPRRKYIALTIEPKISGYELMIADDVFRRRFRNSFSSP